jgi:monovalent cation:H+ antiporter-2, CPA2 family
MARQVGTLLAFVTFLVLLTLLLVPRLLARLNRVGKDVRTVALLGLLLSLAWLAAWAGYSLALGAFVLGVIVAGTTHRPELERAVEGLRDMFGAVFFVAMGMLVDFHLLASAWPMVLAVSAFALVGRTCAAGVGLVLAGHSSRDALRAGLALTPLGEFSFVIAQMGVLAAVIPASWYPVAVGASLLTTLAAPLLMRHGERISRVAEARLPLFLREWITFYHAWLGRLGRRHAASILWKLTGRRLVQCAVQILFASALILLAKPVYEALAGHVGRDWLFPQGLKITFWTGFGVLLLAPLVAIWRNLEALAMIYAEYATEGSPRRRALRPLVETAIRSVALAVLVGWLLMMLPFGGSVLWAWLVVAVVLAALAALFWKRLILWHSRIEIELREQFATAVRGAGPDEFRAMLTGRDSGWAFEVEEFVVPDYALCSGKTLGELALRSRFGCSVASIDRQGWIIANPSASMILYPHDTLLMIGSRDQLDKALADLANLRPDTSRQEIADLSVETIEVPAHAVQAGKTLADLDLMRRFNVQVVGLQRGEARMLSPAGDARIEAGDRLLALGEPRQIQDLRLWLHPYPESSPASSAPDTDPAST